MDVPDTPEPEDYSSLSLPALIEKSDELRAEVERMSQQVATSSSTDIVHVSTTANDLKVSLAIARSTLMSKQAELERVAAALKRKMEIEQAKIAGVVGPMRKQIAMLEEGLWSVSLYLGSGEEIVQIADGDPADIDEPISIRQEILAMDEQMMDIWDGEGLDARHVELFDEWLLDPENLALVLPERRGVIVFRPRRAPRNYGDTFFQKVMDEANKQSYWLIRNGDRLWRMTTNIQVGLHLVPKDDEFEKPFWVEDYSSSNRLGDVHEPIKYDRRRLHPGDGYRYDTALETSEALRRHYMRTTLVLQGLLDRTEIFAPLPVARVDLMDLDTYDSVVRIVRDDERVLADAHVPFQEWRDGLMNKLTVGMRVVGAWAHWNARDEYGPIHPQNAMGPEHATVHRIEDVRDGGFFFKYQRGDKRYGWEHGDWGDWGEWPYKNRASYRISRHDTNVIPIDATTIEEMERYLNWRTERRNYLSMVPLLNAAIAAKKAEAAEEAPFRLLLTGEIVKLGGDPSESEIDGLVHWWKLLNKYHRPLVDDDPKKQAQAVREITTEWSRRAEVLKSGDEETAHLAQFQQEHPDALAIMRKNDGTYVVAERQESKFDRPEGLRPYLKLTLYTFGARKGRTTEVKEWQLVGARRNRWRLLHSTPEWISWPHTAEASAHLTDDEIDTVFEWMDQRWPQAHLIGLRREGGRTSPTYEFFAREIEAFSEDDEMVRVGFEITSNLPDVTEYRVQWARRRSGIEISQYPHGRRISIFGRRDERVDFVESHFAIHRYDSAFVTKVVEERVKPVLAERDRLIKLHHQGHAIYQATVARITEGLEEKAKERFLRDYLDINLWPAHREKISKSWKIHNEYVQEICRRASMVEIEIVGRSVEDVLVEVGPLLEEYWGNRAIPEIWKGVVFVGMPEPDADLDEEDL